MPKTLLITGASSGIGKTTARLFQQHGWNVVASIRNPDKEHELNQLNNVLVTRLEVTYSGTIGQAIAAGIDRFGAVDVLQNDVGFGVYGPLEAIPTESIREQFDIQRHRRAGDGESRDPAHARAWAAYNNQRLESAA